MRMLREQGVWPWNSWIIHISPTTDTVNVLKTVPRVYNTFFTIFFNSQNTSINQSLWSNFQPFCLPIEFHYIYIYQPVISGNERNVSKSKPFKIEYILFNDILSKVKNIFFLKCNSWFTVMTDGQCLKLCHLWDLGDLKTHI